MSTGNAAELGRLLPVDGAQDTVHIPDGYRSLLVANGLGAVIYGRWGTSDTPALPTAADYDFVIPGYAYMVVPIVQGAAAARLLVDYAGAVPVGDVQAIITGSPCTWAPTVGPLV